jgi:hypothetical protein
MKQLSPKARKELKAKMGKALEDKISPLSKGCKDILLDDLVTAFENRLAILRPKEPNMKFFVSERVEVLNETI